MGQTPTLTTQCTLSLCTSILRGDRPPGSRLLCEALQTEYGVGMSAVREALAKLIGTRLVIFEERKGYRVARMTASELRDDLISFAEIETAALKQAITYGDFAWEGAILAAHHHLKRSVNAPQGQFNHYLEALHNALIAACPLNTLLSVRQQLQLRWLWYQRLSRHEETFREKILDEYSAIVQESLTKQIPSATEKLYWQILSSKEAWIAALIEQGHIKEEL